MVSAFAHYISERKLPIKDRQAAVIVTGVVAGIIIGNTVANNLKVRNRDRARRKALVEEMGLDVMALHNATDIINERLEHGEIDSWEQLREAVLNEVAFQKIVIREDPQKA